MTYARALTVGFAMVSAFTTSTARGDVPKIPGPMTSAPAPTPQVIHTCLTAPPDASVTLGDLTKGDGDNAVLFPNLQFDGFLTTPPHAGKSNFYGTTSCPHQYIMDFVATHETKASAPLRIKPSAGARDGQWVSSDGSFPAVSLDTECANVKGDKTPCEKDVCSRLMFWQTGAWKKHGTTSFQTTGQSYIVYTWGGISCIRDAADKHSISSSGDYHPPPAQMNADGYLQPPAKAGDQDVYRQISGVVLLTCPTMSTDPTCSGIASFLRPNQIPNPIVKQFPVRTIVTGKP